MRFQSILSLAFLLLIVSPLPAQTDPVKSLSVETVNTRNFEIVMEKTPEPSRPTPKEVGVLVERLCAQLDKIFLKFAPHRVAEEVEQAKKDEAEGKKTASTKKKTKDDEEIEADPNRVIPKCKIFVFNRREDFEAKCRFDGIEPPGDAYAGFFTTRSNSIYMVRNNSVQNMRQTILHETMHYYSFNFLPGGWRIYPEWFHEGLAVTYEKHVWNGDKLLIGVTPRIQSFDAPAAALIGLRRFRTYLQNEAAKSGESTPAGKKPGKNETPVDPALIRPFLDTMFSPELFVKEQIPLRDPNEAIAHRYAMYLAFGRFLLMGRPDHLEAILKQIALWEKANDKSIPRKDWFVAAWKKASENKPVTVEEIGRWMQKNQLPFKWSFGDWQDLGDQIAGKAEPGMISILAMNNPDTMPKFTAFLKNPAKFQIGVVINFVDNGNFGVVAVDQDGDVLQMEKVRGEWVGAKRIGKTTPIPNKNGPYGNGISFQFAVARQGGMIAVQVNKTRAGVWPGNPNATCGFFISGTEALFTY